MYDGAGGFKNGPRLSSSLLVLLNIVVAIPLLTSRRPEK